MARTRTIAAGLSTVSVLALFAGGAFAQERAPGEREGQQAQRGLAIEEIVVTARKREENLQDVPLSITAFTADNLAAAGIRSIQDIAAFTPGFVMKDEGGRFSNRPVVRGMSNITGERNAAFFIDGVYVSGAVGATDLDNVERVEIVRGPQSALYGRATFAGAINYITKKPSNEFEGKISGTVAQAGEVEIGGWASGPIVRDRLLFYVNGKFYKQDGQYTNTDTGDKVDREKSEAFTAAFTLTPNDWFDATLRGSWQRDDDGQSPAFQQRASFNNCFANDYLLPNGQVNPSPTRPNSRGYYCGTALTQDFVTFNETFFNQNGLELGDERRRGRTSLVMNADIMDMTLTSISAYNVERTASNTDADFSGFFQAPLGFFHTLDRSKRRDWSQQLRLVSSAEQRLRWIVGGYYYHERRNARSASLLQTRVRSPVSDSLNTVKNLAAFAQVEYDITDRWSASVEARYAEDKLSTRTQIANLSAKFDSFTPRFTTKYALSDAAQIYATVAKGNKPGGFNTGLIQPRINLNDAFTRAQVDRLRDFDEEEAWSYELGTKSDFLDGRLRTNVSAYYIDWKKQQLSTNVVLRTNDAQGETPISVTDNIGKTEVYGLEFEASAQILEPWSVRATYAYTHAEIKDFVDIDSAQLFGTNGQVAGNRTPRAPRHTASFSSTWEQPLGAGDFNWFVRGDLVYTGYEYTQVHNLIKTGDAVRVNARLGLRSDVWEITLWVDNLFNDDTVTSILRYVDPQLRVRTQLSPAGTTARAFVNSLPEKRQFGLTASYKF
jgi:outer membrane receptor protein involved in Fe transport